MQLGVSLTEQGYPQAPGALLDWLRAIHVLVTVEVPQLLHEGASDG